MSRLIRNVHAAGVWWGPSHGNADQVPVEVAAKIRNPRVWADGEPPAIPANETSGGTETVLEALPIEDRFPGVPTYEEARARHDATVDVTGMTVPELRNLHDEHGIGWVHRDPKPVLVDRLQQAGVAR